MAKPLPVVKTDSRPLWKRLLLRRLKFLVVVAAVLGVGFGGVYLFAPQLLVKADYARLAMAAHLEKHSVQAGDTNWTYYEGGQGPTIVLLHGFAARKEVWLESAKEMTNHFHVIIPDLPGWGESSRLTDGNYNIDAQAARLDAFFSTLNMKGFMLVGHSMGGAIAGVYAAEHPERIASLVLMDSLGLTFKENDFAREALAGKDPFIFDDRASFEKANELAFLHPQNVPGRVADVFIKENQNDRAFIERTFNQLRDKSQSLALDPLIGKLTMPVLGVWCHDDKIIDVSALETLRNGLKSSPSISATVLNGCNHMPMMERPTETAQILTGFAIAH
ncbi:pimeloyl-ACP methyl ester carboxylesterase [Luteibacter rhizovicinus]|uniref:Pimeloyl-ACP methyl ester carboxylesterase n=1 Tax=Luteibacter rhizovicinus TaxID=242606 RepID=A0A4R3YWL8_9GAMM|nr:alpha/beta hydrolase [Luteibacter rhizovicinus]TCV96228.1 pimeloyl-ACP methyl ester carboxylesterase [Luteibacter rhizovicinus]